LFGREHPPETTQALIAYALIVTGIVFGVATIANDNLQDLKTGQLVGATPWKQQVALVIGVVFGSIVVPPVLQVLLETTGFAGMPGAGPDALGAPQANLISSLATGVLGGGLNSKMLFWGAVAGVFFVAMDEVLGMAKRMRLPPLAIGIGVYLGMATILPVSIGAILGWMYDRWADKRGSGAEFARRMGVLIATGMIVGESLWGVAFAGIVYGTNKESPLALPFIGEGFETKALIDGAILFVALTAWLYRYTVRQVTSVQAMS